VATQRESNSSAAGDRKLLLALLLCSEATPNQKASRLKSLLQTASARAGCGSAIRRRGERLLSSPNRAVPPRVADPAGCRKRVRRCPPRPDLSRSPAFIKSPNRHNEFCRKRGGGAGVSYLYDK
jgi:hypothetical protein